MDKTARMSILYDFYAMLLPDKQEQIFRMYYDENLSLSEIGREMGMSKQGAHDALKKAETALEEFEKKLYLESGSSKNERILTDIKKVVAKLLESTVPEDIKDEIKKIEKDIDRLTV